MSLTRMKVTLVVCANAGLAATSMARTRRAARRWRRGMDLRFRCGRDLLSRMQWPPLSRMLDAMNEVSPFDATAATAFAEGADASSAPLGVLLVNLGTPDAADAPAVR